MKRILYYVLMLVLVGSISSCNLFNNSSNYTQTTKTFTNALLDSNYNVCLGLFNFDKSQKLADQSAVRAGLDSLRIGISKDFGRRLEYSFMSAKKQVPESTGYTVPKNTTLVYIEFHNADNIGALQVLFDDQSGKIDNIKTFRLMQPIPSMTTFWLFGLLAASVVAYNIYALILVYKSRLERKWIYFLAVLILNVPALEYHVMQGIDLKLFAYQYFLGIYFQHIGYLGSVWAIGVPIGAMYACMKVYAAQTKALAATKKK